MLTLERSPVTSDPEIMGGTLAFRGTRVMAQTLLDYLNLGETLETFLDHFPTVQEEQAVEFLNMIRENSNS